MNRTLGMAFASMLVMSVVTLFQATRPIPVRSGGEASRLNSPPPGSETLARVERALGGTNAPTAAALPALTAELDLLAYAFQPLAPARAASAGAGTAGGSPAAEGRAPAAPPPAATLRLLAVLDAGGRTTALLESSSGTLTVHEGTRVEGEHVVAIGQSRVVLRGPRGERVLSLEPGDETR